MSQPVYATPEQYAEWLAAGETPGTPPAGAARALRAASGRVDELLMTAYYDVDEATGLPTDPDVVEALMEATCAQADYQRAAGDKNSTGAQGFASAKIGSASITRGQAAGGTKAPSRYSSEAYSILQRAGLVPSEPWIL